MENFKPIEKCDVWSRLQAGKAVFAVVLESQNFTKKIHDLRKDLSITQIDRLLRDSEKNVAFYEEVKS